MSNPDIYRILLIEDLPSDAELARVELGKVLKKYELVVVDDRNEFLVQLEKFKPDLIISDYRLPTFDGLTALKLTLQNSPDTPVIIFTGSMNEDTAVDCMKAGAVDYVIKEHIKRLGAAIVNALEQVKLKREKEATKNALRETEEKYRTLFENVQDVFYQAEINGTLREISPSIKHFTDFRREELLGKSVETIYYDLSERKKLLQILQQFGEVNDFQIKIKTRTGSIRYGSINARLVSDDQGKPDHIDGSIRDITSRIESEETLRQSEEKFRSLFQNHSAVKLIIDPDTGQIVDANQAAADYYGWSVEELRNMNLIDIHTLSKNELMQILDVAKNSKNKQLETQHKLRSGRIRDVEIFTSTIKIKGKDYLFPIIHDITEKKIIQEQLVLLGKSIEQSPAIVVITAPDGTIEYVNPKFCSVTGYTENEVIGQNPKLLKSGIHPTEFYRDLWTTVLNGQEWKGEICNKKKNGDLYWEDASISPLLNEKEEITHLVAIKEDITEKRKLLEELIVAKERAEASDRLKTAFINNISHEIRTPLNGIVGFSEMITNPDFPAENKILFNDILKKSSRRLMNTVMSYMDISMIVSGTMDIHEKHFSLYPLLESIIDEYEPVAKEKKLEILLKRPDIPAEVFLKSDPDLLVKMMGYLIDNAIKFTSKGTVVIGFRKTGYHLELFVQDTGIGIEKSKLELILGNFVQADTSLTRGYEGSGLGLSISNGLVKMLGGTMRVESEVSKGTTVHLSFPSRLLSTGVETAKVPKVVPLAASNPVILVAEDDEFNYKFLEIILRRSNYEVMRAENGVQAIDLCKSHPNINLVLMDIKMPIMGGIEATRQIKLFRPELTIFALTAYVSSKDEYEALLSGCDDFVPKPVNRVYLLDKIRTTLGQS